MEPTRTPPERVGTFDGSAAVAALDKAHAVLVETQMRFAWPIRWWSLPRTLRSEFRWERHGGRVSRLRAVGRASWTVVRVARGW